MKILESLVIFIFLHMIAYGQQDNLQENVRNQTEFNKQIARDFYRDLWFTNNTEKYTDYVADEYIVHDIGNRKNVTEPAIVQKSIADMFWNNGKLTGEIEYQIAEGDLVATKWIGYMQPETLFGKVFLGKKPMHIINVFRINDGKIVEFWNHRHDIDSPQTLKFVLKGFLIGLTIALIPAFLAIRYKRKLKRLSLKA